MGVNVARAVNQRGKTHSTCITRKSQLKKIWILLWRFRFPLSGGYYKIKTQNIDVYQLIPGAIRDERVSAEPLGSGRAPTLISASIHRRNRKGCAKPV